MDMKEKDTLILEMFIWLIVVCAGVYLSQIIN